MKDKREAWVKQCELDRVRWQADHRAWLERIQQMKRCEQKVMGLMFELDNALPNHQARLNDLQGIVTEHKKYLESHACDLQCMRNDFIDDECATELKNFSQLGVSRCTTCDPQCFGALRESHQKVSMQHDHAVKNQARIEVEYHCCPVKELAARK